MFAFFLGFSYHIIVYIYIYMFTIIPIWGHEEKVVAIFGSSSCGGTDNCGQQIIVNLLPGSKHAYGKSPYRRRCSCSLQKAL